MWPAVLSIVILLVGFKASAQIETTVYFQFDRYTLTDKSKAILDTIGSNNKNASIEIFGHCDQLGSKDYNYMLSEQRANAVRDYLISKGFVAGNIKTIKGFGEDMLAIDKLDAASRKANRRVTVATTDTVVSEIPVVPPTEWVSDTPRIVPTPPPVKVQRKEKLVDEIRDTSTKAGQNIILKNINFYGGSHRFLPTTYPALQDLLEAMQKIPTLVIEIHGHICCRDDEGDGMDNDTGEPFLSYNRARAVYEFLIRRDIDRRRMTFKGFGHKFPLYDVELTEEERTANRRVEIKIISK